MKNLIILCLLIITSCTNAPLSETESTAANFDWMVGKWERTNEMPGKVTIESWIKLNDTEYHGSSVTTQDRDTVWAENVHLRKMGNDWNYEVNPLGDITVTPFKLTSINETGFVSENEKNDFPKKITYELMDQEMHAVISGGGETVPYVFKRLE